MRRIFGLLTVSLAIAGGLLAAFGLPGIFGHSVAPAASAATAPQQIGMRILVITDSANSNAGIAYGDWTNTLQREGVPYQSVVTNSTAPGSVALPALSSTLSDGTQVANYQGVVVTVSGTLGLTDAQWATLQTFEHQFSVRQITGYVVPNASYGLSGANPVGGAALPLGTSLSLTSDGQKVFPYLKTAAVDPTQSTWAYEATPLSGAALAGGSVDTLISGPSNSSLLGIYTSADGRQTMYQTFNENQYYLQSELLRHGELAWLTRGTYFGDQRNYVEMDIDDTFTPDDAWNTATHEIDYSDADALRMQPADVGAATTWEAQNKFRMDQLFNMGGTVNNATQPDPLLQAFQATCSSNCGPSNAGAGKSYAASFGWISHTYDTPYLDVGCATQNYIEAELNENTNVAHTLLGLTESTDPAVSLGAENPKVFVPGNHSGFANLVPGNPATVDPPILDTPTATTLPTTGGTLPAGYYEYAVTDQFTNSPSAGQSAADIVGPFSATGSTSSGATLTWQAICHAADYVVYRGYSATSPTGPFTWTLLPPATGSAYGAVSTPFSATLPNTSSGDPASTTDVTNGGELNLTYTDPGAAGTPATAPSTSAENAVETPWEQNPYFAPALAAVGITSVGDDGSKPYPNPATDEFGYGVAYTGTEYPADATWMLPGTSAQVVPRHPINIYYNASTDAMELDEYQTLYNNTPTCGNTTCTWSDVINQVVSGMWGYVMANDPRPSYVHQTNIMGTPPAGSESTNGLPPSTYTPPATCPAGAPCTKGDGTLYQVLDPLLYEYNQYFNSTAPFEQLTQQAIANLLAEQSAWAGTSAVTGHIEGNQVTVANGTAAAFETPLTGVEGVGSSYAGSQSGWTDAPAGNSSYTAFTTWPAEPTNQVIVQVPNGSAPGGQTAHGPNPNKPITPTTKKPVTPAATYYAVQAAPKAVSIKRNKVTVSLTCKASRGKTAKGKVCAGRFTLNVSGHMIAHTFRFKSGKVDRIAIKLSRAVQVKAARAARHTPRKRNLSGRLVITTKLSGKQTKVSRGTLTIKT